MAKYRKKPVVIDAVRLTEKIEINTLEGKMIGNPGDWLITGVNGEEYPCKDDIFQKSYELVEFSVDEMTQKAENFGNEQIERIKREAF